MKDRNTRHRDSCQLLKLSVLYNCGCKLLNLKHTESQCQPCHSSRWVETKYVLMNVILYYIYIWNCTNNKVYKKPKWAKPNIRRTRSDKDWHLCHPNDARNQDNIWGCSYCTKSIEQVLVLTGISNQPDSIWFIQEAKWNQRSAIYYRIFVLWQQKLSSNSNTAVKL